MSKFKVGDKVIVKKTNYPFKAPYIGKTYTINAINPNKANPRTHYGVAEPCFYVFEETELELAVDNTEKIVITTNGKVTIAKHYKGDKLVKTTESKCHPDDKFDFITGAKLAVERLKEHEYYNGKVVCYDFNGCNEFTYTLGKIYEFVDGKITTDNGLALPREFRCKSFDEWSNFSSSKWVEIKEDTND